VAALVHVLRTLSNEEPFGQLARLEELYDDPRPLTARLARQWVSQARESAGDAPGAVQACRDALALCDDLDGPWTRAILMSQLAGLAIQVGELDEARRYAETAIPVMRALGAHEDALQLVSVLAVAELTAGRVAEAERLLDEIATQDEQQSVFGGMIVVLCGRAELALVRGQGEDGLRLYRDAVATMRSRKRPGFDLPGASPWVVYPESGALAAHARQVEDGAGGVATPGALEGGRVLSSELAATVRELLTAPDAFVDYPVVGAVVFALAMWDLCARRPGDDQGESLDRAVRLLAIADAFAFNRMLPSLSWAWAQRTAERRCPGGLAAASASHRGRRAVELRDETARLVAEL
jgi:hypothetical protein